MASMGKGEASMWAALSRMGLALTVALTLSACGGKREPQLLNLNAGSDTPDEFAILPGKPLQTPENITELPAPTPGASNLTDPTPKADAIVALGGNAAVLARSGIPATDRALLGYTGRHGTEADIREQLAAADLDFRRRKDVPSLYRLFKKSRYFKVYSSQALDQYLELERLRAAGIKTPSAPPGI